jgi:hypothetical protein
MALMSICVNEVIHEDFQLSFVYGLYPHTARLRSWKSKKAMKQSTPSLKNELVGVACALTFATSVLAQGTVDINNHLVGALVTQVYWMNPMAVGSVQSGNGPNDTPAGTTDWNIFTPLSGTGFTAQVWAANGFDQPQSALQPAFPTTTFHTGPGAGFVSPTMATLTGVPPGGSATATLRVWDNQCGTITNWDQAQSHGVACGQSPLFNLCCVGGGIIPPPDLVGLQSFNLGGCLSPYFSAWSTQPIDQVVLQGETVTFVAQAGGCPTPSYQWFHDGVPVTSNSLCTCYTYQITNVQPSDAGNYWAVAYGLSVDHSATNSTSAVATLTVHTLPTITAQPRTQADKLGTSADFWVLADGVPPLTYQWFFNASPIPNAISNHLYFPILQSSQSGTYQVVVTGPFGSVTSAPALLYVLPNRPTIVASPPSWTVEPGSTVDFSVVANGTPPLGYQWFFNATNAIPGAANALLELTNVQFSQVGSYRVVVTGPYGSVTSAPAMLTVVARPPTIVFSPNSLTVDLGWTAYFSVVANGTPPLNYQWFFNSTNVMPAGVNAELFLPNVQFSQAGNYQVVVTSPYGSITSAPALLTVSAHPPTIAISPRSQTVGLASNVEFYVVANGTPPFGYQWFFNVTNAIPSTVGEMLELTNVQFSQAGSYTVLVTNAFGSAVSTPAMLTVEAPALPVLKTKPVTQTTEIGSAAAFQVRAEGYPPVSYYWLFNETNVVTSASEDDALLLTDVQPIQAGAYAAVVTNILGAVTSAPALLNVIPPVPRRMVPAVAMSGQPGSLLNLDFTDALNTPADWRLLESVYLTNAPLWYVDLSTPLPPQTFYRAWQSTAASEPPTLNIYMIPAFSLTGQTGNSIRVDYINKFGPIDAWVTLATVSLTNSTQLFLDTSMVGQPPRLYRVIQMP